MVVVVVVVVVVVLVMEVTMGVVVVVIQGVKNWARLFFFVTRKQKGDFFSADINYYKQSANKLFGYKGVALSTDSIHTTSAETAARIDTARQRP